MAKTTCTIPIEAATQDNKGNSTLNDRLKKHQRIKSVSFEIDIENLKSDKNSKIVLVFETTQSKKFQSLYNQYNKNLSIWKNDFSKSQIFPELSKNFLNLTLFNSKYYLRLYDSPTEKTMVNLKFDTTNCSPVNSSLLSKAGAF